MGGKGIFKLNAFHILKKKKDNFYIKFIANAFQTSLSSIESGDNGGLSEAVRTMVGNIRS